MSLSHAIRFKAKCRCGWEGEGDACACYPTFLCPECETVLLTTADDQSDDTYSL